MRIRLPGRALQKLQTGKIAMQSTQHCTKHSGGGQRAKTSSRPSIGRSVGMDWKYEPRSRRSYRANVLRAAWR